MNNDQRPEVSPEFQLLYEQIDVKTLELANSILKHVEANDERILKKVLSRMTAVVEDIKQVK